LLLPRSPRYHRHTRRVRWTLGPRSDRSATLPQSIVPLSSTFFAKRPGPRRPGPSSSTASVRHPAEMGAAEVTAFLTALAVRERVAASTQNQALNALLFLYREILGVELPWLDDLVRAKRPQHLPT
jgi:hypothetical protein